MLSNFRNFYAKSVDAFKQVQEQVLSQPPGGAVNQPQAAEGGQPASAVDPSTEKAAPVPTVVVKTHPYFDIVERYEKKWETMSNNGAELSNRMLVEDQKVKLVVEKCDSEFAAWSTLQSELEQLDSVVETVNQCREEMEGLCADLKSLDEALDGHLKAKEERDLLRWKGSINQQTADFEANRAREVQKLEKSLKAEQDRRARAKAAEEAKIEREKKLAAQKEAKQKADEERKAKVEAEKQAAAKAKEEAAAAAKAKESEQKESEKSAEKEAPPKEAPPKEEKTEAAPEDPAAGEGEELELSDEVLNAVEAKEQDSAGENKEPEEKPES